MKTPTRRSRLLTSTLVAGTAFFAPAALITTIALPTLAVAQDYTSGNLTGRVEDQEGAGVPGATVTVRSGQGATRTAVTDDNGRYQINALAVGQYRAEVTAEGYDGLNNQRISVQAGGSSFAFALAKPGTVGELVVTGARRTTDFARTDTGLVVEVQDLAERIPVGRSISNIALLTPGVSRPDATIAASSRRNQSTVVIAGTSAAESVYYINGMNVTDLRNLLGYADLPFDAIATMDIKTGGYQAEFGRATGGVVNIVTRSGSNEWHGGLTLTYQPDDLQSSAPMGFSGGGATVAGAVIYNDVASQSLLDTSAYLSGPILKDRLFFFGLYNPRSIKEYYPLTSSGLTGDNLYTGVQSYTKTTSPRWLAKLDLNITDTQRLEATLFSDKSETERKFFNRDVRVGITGQGLGFTEEAGGFNQIYKYTGVFTDWFTLSAMYGNQESSQRDFGDLINTPRVRDLRVPGVTTYMTGANTSAVQQPIGEDTRKTYRVDADFYAKFYGDHHIRVGFDKEELHSVDEHLYNGGFRMDVRHASPGPGLPVQDYALVTVLGSAGSFDAEQTAFYIQDSWDITDNLTIQAGLRNDKYDYKNRAGESYISLDDQWAPRLGFTWDPFSEGRDRVYGSFGRYYLPIATNTSIRAVSGEDFHQEYRAIQVRPDGSIVVDANGVPIVGERLRPDNILALPIAPAPGEIAAQNINPMYEQEFILGYEHQFAEGMLDGWRAGVRYVNRNLKSTIEDTDLGRGGVLTRYCERTDDPNCRANTNTLFTGAYVLLNPGSSAEITLDLENGPNGPNLRPITLTAEDLQLPKAERKYEALEFTFERPFDGKWSLQGSYVLAKSKGNYEGAVKSDIGQDDTSITQDFDAYFLANGAYGYLPNDHRHTFKLFGAYQVTEQFRVGANFFAQSGRPYGCIGYSPFDEDPGGAPSAWYCPRNGESVLTPRGSQGRTGWVTSTDVNLTYDLIPYREGFGAVSASMDVFNLFNERNVTRVVEQGEVHDVPGTAVPTWGRQRSFQAPRSVRFSLRYSF